MTREIPLSQGKSALIDDDDFERVTRFKWCAVRMKGERWYAKRVILQDGRHINCYLHRFILGVPDGIHVDHENGDGLDCRKANMRLASSRQNARNARLSSRNTSGFKGVFAMGGRWAARIVIDGRVRHLGVFDTGEEAARAYDAAARRFFGSFARCNFAAIDRAAEAEVERRAAAWERGDRARQPGGKLTDEDVASIRRRYLAGGVLLRELAAEYGVCQAAIGHCLRGHTFAHVSDPPPLVADKRRSGSRLPMLEGAR